MDDQTATIETTNSSGLTGRNKLRTPILHDDMHDHPHTAASPPKAGRVSRTLVNFWLDVVLGAAFVLLSVAAVIVQFVFPPGTATKGWFLWGMSYGQWCSIQFALIALLGIGVLVHVMLHWTWVCGVLSKRILNQSEIPDDGIRTVYGVGLLIALLLFGAVVVGVAQMTIVSPNVSSADTRFELPLGEKLSRPLVAHRNAQARCARLASQRTGLDRRTPQRVSDCC
ncbi:MAG: DUF4405 domain-containing protein [Planctomycetaceae bacterium]|nr:DUF4405 domain-containing protein [Planctomycetaceae bacterium]